MYDLIDVIPWSLIYGELNKQHKTESKTIAFQLLDYLSGCADGNFKKILDNKIDDEDFTCFCWQEVKRYLNANDIEKWHSQKIERIKKKYEFEEVIISSLNRLDFRIGNLLRLL
jgi:hypothetical protein